MSSIPMPEPTCPRKPLRDYKVLSFDVYGTLIEYKSHILEAFQPLISRLPASSKYLDNIPLSSTIPDCATVGQIEFLKLFQRQEDAIKLEKDSRRFDAILVEIWRRIAKELDVELPHHRAAHHEAKAFGSEATIKSWPLFPGTIDALKALSRHYHLIALSNIDRYAWDLNAHSVNSPLHEVNWWKIFTAEYFGEDLKRADDVKLETLVKFCEQHGVQKDEILHIAQSLGHDHAPAKRLGIASVFLTGDGPKWGKEAESKKVVEEGLVGYGWRCKDLKEFIEIYHNEKQEVEEH